MMNRLLPRRLMLETLLFVFVCFANHQLTACICDIMFAVLWKVQSVYDWFLAIETDQPNIWGWIVITKTTIFSIAIVVYPSQPICLEKNTVQPLSPHWFTRCKISFVFHGLACVVVCPVSLVLDICEWQAKLFTTDTCIIKILLKNCGSVWNLPSERNKISIKPHTYIQSPILILGSHFLGPVPCQFKRFL